MSYLDYKDVKILIWISFSYWILNPESSYLFIIVFSAVTSLHKRTGSNVEKKTD